MDERQAGGAFPVFAVTGDVVALMLRDEHSRSCSSSGAKSRTRDPPC